MDIGRIFAVIAMYLSLGFAMLTIYYTGYNDPTTSNPYRNTEGLKAASVSAALFLGLFSGLYIYIENTHCPKIQTPSYPIMH